jgi:hypothetical protein
MYHDYSYDMGAVTALSYSMIILLNRLLIASTLQIIIYNIVYLANNCADGFIRCDGKLVDVAGKEDWIVVVCIQQRYFYGHKRVPGKRVN